MPKQILSPIMALGHGRQDWLALMALQIQTPAP